ncbi:MAG: hypothetical protein SFT81_03225 [Candidatus Caenarcaniphilales bacterium]|nr:hypothetical protein [Candidatus Caenarcaniphilales bacterium]
MKKWLETLEQVNFTRGCSDKTIIVAISFLLMICACAYAEDAQINTAFFHHLKSQKTLLSFPTDPLEYRILKEYGAFWVNSDEAVLLPQTLIFEDRKATESYQKRLELEPVPGFSSCLLQKSALKALKQAQAERKLTPRGTDSCLRDYITTEKLWLSRVNPNLAYYVSIGKLSQKEADRIRALSPKNQVSEILKLEEKGLLFDKYRQTSILNSVAAPGSSQHLSGLAFDLSQYADPKARTTMNKYGWYQTVLNDLPHFTYLGKLTEKELRDAGLKKVVSQGYSFWVPNL